MTDIGPIACTMPWQPDKFRRMLGAPSVDLPTSGAAVTLDPATPLDSEAALGVLLHDAAGIYTVMACIVVAYIVMVRTACCCTTRQASVQLWPV